MDLCETDSVFLSDGDYSRVRGRTLSILYKRRPKRDGRQILEKDKRQGLAFSEKLRDNPGQTLESIKRRVHAHSSQAVSEVTTAPKVRTMHFYSYFKRQPIKIYMKIKRQTRDRARENVGKYKKHA